MATIPEIRKSTEQKMQKSVEALKADLARIRTGRAHAGLLDHIVVDYYGTPTPIAQIAKIAVIDARALGVTPWEKKLLQAVEKAIRDSDLGLNPISQGDVIRVPMPPLTEERRRDLTKVVKHDAEGARVAIRNLRRDANHGLKELLKSKEASEDDERRAQDDVQKLTDRFIAEIEKIVQAKEQELLTV
ncbi:MAG: ribosome recycling factor [Burkholderiales bacterium]